MKINMQKWTEDLLRSEVRHALPIMTHPGIDLTGKTVLDAVTDGKIHSEAIIAMQKAFPMAAATIIMDLTVESEAFGSPLNFAKHEVPTVSARIVSDFDSVQKLQIPSLETARIPQYLLAAKLAAKSITNVPVFAGCIGPFSLAGRLFDMTEIMTAAYIEPETVHLLLEKCSALLKLYVRAFKETGANGIIMAEPAAGMLSEEMCQALSSDYIKNIVDEIQDDQFMVILHNCGNTGHVTQCMVNTGANGLHFGNKIDILQVLSEVPSGKLVLGNLDPVGVFKMGNKQTVQQATRSLLDKTKDYRNFVISSGCDTPPGVPLENIRAFFEEINR